jgi:hypothetical protein
MMRKFLFAVLAAITVASAADASTITYAILPGFNGPGTFALTAETSIGDNFGLFYYAVNISGAATTNHVSVSPRGIDVDTELNYGFTFARSPDSSLDVSAAQDSTGGGVAVYGMGQTAGTLKSLIPAGDTFAGGRPDANGTYGAPLVLATGTYLNNIPSILPGSTGFVFTSKGTGGAFGSFAAPTSIIIDGGCLACQPHFSSATIDNVDPDHPGFVYYTWPVPINGGTFHNLQFDSYVPAAGATGSGPVTPPTLDTAQRKFHWDTVGSPLGSYKWLVTATNSSGSSSGTITVNVTVPEPATLTLIGLAFSCVIFRCRR